MCPGEEGEEEVNPHTDSGITERWVYDRERQRGSRPNGESQGKHTLCPGDQGEGKQSKMSGCRIQAVMLRC